MKTLKVCAEFLGNQKLNDENTLFIIHCLCSLHVLPLLPCLVSSPIDNNYYQTILSLNLLR